MAERTLRGRPLQGNTNAVTLLQNTAGVDLKLSESIRSGRLTQTTGQKLDYQNHVGRLESKNSASS